MNEFILDIAGYKLQFITGRPNEKMSLSDVYSGFRSLRKGHDLVVRVHRHQPQTQGSPHILFKAGYYQEADNKPIQISEDFWEVTDYGNERFVEARVPDGDQQRKIWLRFDMENRMWDLYLNTEESRLNPLFYPIDALLLYYFITRQQGLLLHGSAVNDSNTGYIFSGPSGAGKTTMAGLWNQTGAEVIHDDRLIVRTIGADYHVFNTPVYPGDHSRKTRLSGIYLLKHGKENKLTRLSGARAAGSLSANCIQHAYENRLIDTLLDTAAALSARIPVYELAFKPDASVIKFLRENG